MAAPRVKTPPFLFLLLVLLCGGILFVIWLGRRPERPLVSVNLIGQTNDTAGTIFYIFEATNAASRAWRVSYQTQVPEGPTSYPPMSQQKLWVFDAPLPAESALSFAFPAPREALATWCVVLFYEDPPAAWRGHVNNLAKAMGASKRVVDDFPRKYVRSQNISKP
jgi:hypothetical protein